MISELGSAAFESSQDQNTPCFSLSVSNFIIYRYTPFPDSELFKDSKFATRVRSIRQFDMMRVPLRESNDDETLKVNVFKIGDRLCYGDCHRLPSIQFQLITQLVVNQN